MVTAAVLVAGEALIDLIVRPDGQLDAIPGGGPFNTARTVARLGVGCAFLGRLSTDRLGHRLADALEQDGVSLELVQRTDEPTTLALAEVDDLGAATYRFYVERTSVPGLRDVALPSGIRALHVGTLGLRLEPIGSELERLVEAAPEGVIVMLDVNARPSLAGDAEPWRERVRRIARRADIVKASRDDLAFLGSAPDELLALGTRVALVTAGPDPVVIVTPAGTTVIPVPAVDVVDTVGAGDAFGGGFLAAWLACGHDGAALRGLGAVQDAVATAVRVAALTCQRAGAHPPRREEVAGFGRC